MRPLAGIRVLDFRAAQAGRLATAVLAELGADVVMVRTPDSGEAGSCARPWGTGRRRARPAARRSRRTVALDLAAPAGQDIAARLAAVADVVVDGLPAPAMERSGLGRAGLETRNAGLIHCSFESIARDSLGGAAGELVCSVRAVTGILAALHERASSGVGRRIEVPSPAGPARRGASALARPWRLGRHCDEVIEDWLGCRVTDIERLRFEGAFG